MIYMLETKKKVHYFSDILILKIADVWRTNLLSKLSL